MIDESDKAEEAPTCYIFTKITIENFENKELTPEALQQFASDMAASWTDQLMTSASLVTFQSFPVKGYFFVDEKGNVKEEK